MKTILTVLAVAALALPAASPALAAPGHDDRGRDNHGQQVKAMARTQGNPFHRGERFDSRRAPQYTVINYRSHRGLKAPPRGYHWVRSGNDALLVAIGTGVIASIIANSF